MYAIIIIVLLPSQELKFASKLLALWSYCSVEIFMFKVRINIDFFDGKKFLSIVQTSTIIAFI